jgi:hypothetical protein
LIKKLDCDQISPKKKTLDAFTLRFANDSRHKQKEKIDIGPKEAFIALMTRLAFDSTTNRIIKYNKVM